MMRNLSGIKSANFLSTPLIARVIGHTQILKMEISNKYLWSLLIIKKRVNLLTALHEQEKH